LFGTATALTATYPDLSAGGDPEVTMNDGPGVPPERAPETTSVFRADFLSEAEPPVQDPAVSGADALPEGAALLVVKRGPNAGSRFLLDRAVTSAGRHPDSDIFLDDVTVSRRHAEFRSDAGEFVVVDVGSLNGTYVNREPVDTAVLVDGDEVQIGKFRLVFITGPRG
jgi:pSer/pThr/pTyr-binding forkhead associated (FHA) protein